MLPALEDDAGRQVIDFEQQAHQVGEKRLIAFRPGWFWARQFRTGWLGCLQAGWYLCFGPALNRGR